MSIKLIDRPSPNFGARPTSGHGEAVTMLVMHYTGMTSCKAALERLCDARAEVSAHVLIDEDGTAYRLVADEQRAWHAGQAYWRGISDINSASIGIELVNPGHEHGYRDFPERQIDTLVETCLTLIAKFDIPQHGIVGHSDVAPGRKKDPGELFPWEHLAAANVGLWPSKNHRAPISGTAWEDLNAIGYAIPRDDTCGSSILDPKTAETDVITAFQRRFLPGNLSGTLDAATLERVATVRETYSKSLI